MRVNPTFNEYNKKIIIALSHKQSIEPATLVKQGIYELIKNKSEKELNSLIEHYNNMTEEERKNPNK